jgi:hypothetical protein
MTAPLTSGPLEVQKLSRTLGPYASCYAVRVATATTLAANTRTVNELVANANGAMGTIDGATMAVDDLVLVKDEVAGANNGIYKVTSLGSASTKWTMLRAPGLEKTSDVTSGMLVISSEGTAGLNCVWMLTTNAPITLNSTALVFASIGTATASDATPAALAQTAAAGTSPNLSRADHVHASPIFIRSKAFTYADCQEADQDIDIAFAAALPAGAIVIGAGINVTAVFDNAGDTANVVADLGHSGDKDAFCDGMSLDAIAKVGAVSGQAMGTLVGAVTPSINVLPSVNGNTLTKGTAVAYVLYTLAF